MINNFILIILSFVFIIKCFSENIAEIRAIDRITGRSYKLKIPLNDEVVFNDNDKELINDEAKKIIHLFKEKISELEVFDRENLEQIINGLLKLNNINFKGIGQPLRIMLTGSKFGPGIYDIIISLGKNEVIKRLGNIG